MIFLIAGTISTFLCLASMISTGGGSGKHREWSNTEKSNFPNIFQVLWFFLSLVAIFWGYLLISLGE